MNEVWKQQDVCHFQIAVALQDGGQEFMIRDASPVDRLTGRKRALQSRFTVVPLSNKERAIPALRFQYRRQQRQIAPVIRRMFDGIRLP